MAKVAGDRSDVMAAIPMACADEGVAVEFLEEMRWDGEPSCPGCGDLDVYMMEDRKTGERNARYLWRCRGCGRQFTVRIGNVMEDSRIAARHWCFAFWAACSSKKGVSALQIKWETGLTYKSALLLMHRIRYAMNGAANTGPLSGDVEADATYVGGIIRPRSIRGKRRSRGYWRMDDKTAIHDSEG
jgi:transposase-like protein